MTDIVLGKMYQDNISSFKGIAIGFTTWQWGCITIGLAPTSLDKDGELRETRWFDEDRLVLIEAVLETPTEFTGGPENMGPGEANR